MGKYTEAHLVKLEPEQKARLKAKADQAEISLSDAMRDGAEQYLDALIARTPVPSTYTTKNGRVLTDADFERLADEEDPAPLLAEFHAVASRIEGRLKGGR